MESCERCKYQDKSEHEEPCVGYVHNAVENFEPMTNADRIRSMTDEELAEFLRESISNTGENMFLCCEYEKTEHCIGHTCKNCGAYIAWLKSEVWCE